MAGVRVELLVVLLLASVGAWERLSETQSFNFNDGDQLDEQESVTPPDEEYDEDQFPQVEGTATSEDFEDLDSFGWQVDAEDSGPKNGGNDGDFEMEFVDAHPRTWNSSTSLSSTELNVFCTDTGFEITLTGPLSEVNTLGSKDLSVMDAPESCGYEVDSLKNTLTVPFTGCNVQHVDSCQIETYSLQLMYVDEFGQTQVQTASCERSPMIDPRSSGKPRKCTHKHTEPSPSKAQNCGATTRERLTCGRSRISYSECEMMGCCVDTSKSTCYYPMDECTADHHFVFAIRSNSGSTPVDPTKLVIPGSPHCKPVIVNHKVAIFKFKVTECGVRAYEVDEMKIYLAEVQTVVRVLNLKYGIITRSDPLRFMIECRYSKTGSAQQALASVGYMVKIPTSNLPSAVFSPGLYAVELKIAKDKTYSSFLPTHHQPLHLLLGNPVYLELNLKSPKPYAVILVNYCLAYPRSAKNALVLVYEGCANPYDPGVSILKVSDHPTNRHQRRFVVHAFQFMDQKTNKYLNEEIYFMCSTEVCRPTEKTCEQQCFDGKASRGFAAGYLQ